MAIKKQTTNIDPKAEHSSPDNDLIFLEKIADKICKHGLETPAVLFLEMTKPISLLGSHFLVFFGPIINSFIHAENYYRTVEVFEEPGNIERLLKAIEHRARK
tara:strand:- start:18 stop:326 length:309 start_codon:yes stop_codon:yes gene_type:complete